MAITPLLDSWRGSREMDNEPDVGKGAVLGKHRAGCLPLCGEGVAHMVNACVPPPHE